MTDRTRRTIGLIMAIMGLALLILNAANYLLKWNQATSGLTGIGIMLVVIGVGHARYTRNKLLEEKKP